MTRPLPFLARCRSNVFRAPFFLLWTALCGTLSLLSSLFDKPGRVQHAIAHVWARGCVFFSGARLTVRGAANLRQHPVAVYASNHTSYMDTPVIFATLPFQFRILARKQLWGLPFIGWHLNRSGQLPIDTDNPHASLSSLGAGARALRAGMPLFVFPEGGRTNTGELREFLAGAAFLAIRAQVPLVPIGLSGVYDLLPIHTHHFHPCPVTLAVGEPIQTKGMTLRQTEELTARLRTAVAELASQPTAPLASSTQAMSSRG
ncbi:MAG TPA: lysophospholipid acyltransferase family protein [Terracidiphilus sp.]|jgi:1-acyl-sn-glycerol-3-phosphate acyltransferase|nr:lysophospholipid acyltransferase family protein [Terracidiphilus sp.]